MPKKKHDNTNRIPKWQAKKTNSIPTDEEFERAAAAMSAERQILDKIRERILHSIAGHPAIHQFHLWGSHRSGIEAYVFYKIDYDIVACRNSGVEEELRKLIVGECVEFETDQLTPPTVTVKFDSHENVKREFNGNYWKYFR